MLSHFRGRLPRAYFVTTPTSMVKRLTGQESWPDPIAFPDGCTFNGQPAPGAGSNVVNTTATILALTAVLHANKVVVVDSAASAAITLPAATGTGNIYSIFINTPATGTASTIATAASAQVMSGVNWAATTASNAVIAYVATATDNKITINGTTQGGVKGDRIVFIDVKTSTWSVQMFSSPTGSTATPFSHV